MMKLRGLFVSLAIIGGPLLAGCNQSSYGPGQGNHNTPPPGTLGYYTFNPGLGVVGYPINGTAQIVATLAPTVGNGLGTDLNIAFDANGRLFVVNQDLGANPSTISVFTPPLTSSSNATYILTMPFPGCTYGIAFDAANRLWVSDCNTHIYEFKGPFTSTGILPSADVTLTAPGGFAFGLAFDGQGNLWVALDQNSGGIAEYKVGAGFTSSTPIDHTLTGDKAESIGFDKAGDLFAAGFGQMTVEYLAANVSKAGGTPDVINPTGLAVGFRGSQITFDTAGNLYVADCGGAGGHIFVYPTSTMLFSATLSPFSYADANITGHFCAAGVAIH